MFPYRETLGWGNFADCIQTVWWLYRAIASKLLWFTCMSRVGRTKIDQNACFFKFNSNFECKVIFLHRAIMWMWDHKLHDIQVFLSEMWVGMGINKNLAIPWSIFISILIGFSLAPLWFSTICKLYTKEITFMQMNWILCGQMFLHVAGMSSVCCDWC